MGTLKSVSIFTYKTKIDNAVANNEWIIFLSHSNSSSEFDPEYMEELMDYLISKNVPILTLIDAWEYKKNYTILIQ